MKIATKISQDILSVILVIFFTITLGACNREDKTNLSVKEQAPKIFQCIADQSQCQFDLAQAKVRVLFDGDRIVAEQPFNIMLEYRGTETLKAISGYLEGVDMYMGKIPLFFDVPVSSGAISTNKLIASKTAEVKSTASSSAKISAGKTLQKTQNFQTKVLLGSCSAAQMQWRIWLTFITEKDKSYTKMFTLQSYRS